MKFLLSFFLLTTFSAQADNTLKKRTLFVDDHLRKYLVSVPKKKHNQNFPVLFALHGGGGSHKKMAEITQYHNQGKTENWIVVYPQALKYKFKSNWNDGRVHTQNGKSSIAKTDDVKFILKILKRLNKNYKIDNSRIFITGVSNGGFMAQRLASEQANVFTAMASVIGSMSKKTIDEFNPNDEISILMINGTQDPLIPYNGGLAKFGRNNLGYSHPVEEVITKWVEHNGLNNTAKTINLPDLDPNDDCKIEQRIYSETNKNTIVKHLKLHGGGHTIAGSKQKAPERLVGKTCYDINANNYIIEFFASF